MRIVCKLRKKNPFPSWLQEIRDTEVLTEWKKSNLTELLAWNCFLFWVVLMFHINVSTLLGILVLVYIRNTNAPNHRSESAQSSNTYYKVHVSLGSRSSRSISYRLKSCPCIMHNKYFQENWLLMFRKMITEECINHIEVLYKSNYKFFKNLIRKWIFLY